MRWPPECRIQVNPKRVRRLMKMLGLEAAYPRPRSPAREAHARWPERLRPLVGLPGRAVRSIPRIRMGWGIWTSRSRTRSGVRTSRTFGRIGALRTGWR
jgi:hypothetical protein